MATNSTTKGTFWLSRRMGYQRQQVLCVHAIGVVLVETNDALLLANEVIALLGLAPCLPGGNLKAQGHRIAAPVSFSQLATSPQGYPNMDRPCFAPLSNRLDQQTKVHP